MVILIVKLSNWDCVFVRVFCSFKMLALRKTMVRAHRQAWAWQDEWHGLTMEDIREIEKQTQLALKRKMGKIEGEIG